MTVPRSVSVGDLLPRAAEALPESAIDCGGFLAPVASVEDLVPLKVQERADDGPDSAREVVPEHQAQEEGDRGAISLVALIADDDELEHPRDEEGNQTQTRFGPAQ